MFLDHIKSMIPSSFVFPDIKESMAFINSVVEICEENEEESVKTFRSFVNKYGQKMQKFVLNIIELAATIRPKERSKMNIFIDIIKDTYMFDKTGRNGALKSMLAARRIIKPFYGMNKMVFDLYEEDSIGRAIVDDDVSSLKNMLLLSKNLPCLPYDSLFLVLMNDTGELTLLQLSAFLGSLNCFKYLLMNGETINEDLCTFAVSGGSLEIVHLCEQHGMKFTRCIYTSVEYHRNDIFQWIRTHFDCGAHLLHTCIEYDNYSLLYDLVENGYDVNENLFNHYPLASAAFYDSVGIISYLIDIGCDINAKGIEGETALILATKTNNINSLELLIHKRCDINIKDNKGITALHYAAQKGFSEAVEILLNNGADLNVKDNNGCTPLFYAMLNHHYDIAKLLISKGVDLNIKDNKGNALIHNEIELLDLKMCVLLVESGCAINVKDNCNGYSPLHIAVKKNFIKMVSILVKKGCEIDAKDNKGNTPLHIAVISCNFQASKILIDNGCDVRIKNMRNDTPLILAIKNGSYDIIDLLLKEGLDVNEKDNNGNTPLSIAIKWNWFDIFELLARNKGDILACDNNGNTYLHIATLCKNIPVVELLLYSAVGVNKTNNKGETPLHIAASLYSEELIQLLIQYGADINANDKKGRIPFDMVPNSKKEQAKRFLLPSK